MDRSRKKARHRKIDPNQLERILEANHLWITSGKRAGKAADLRDVDLRGHDLRGANLEGADLAGADLRDVDLLHTNLWKSNLQDVDMSGAKNLSSAPLAGANLSGAILPTAMSRTQGLQHLELTAGIARPIFLLMIVVCIYAFATIASTTDASLISNSASALLPDLDTPIPTMAFYMAGPIVLFTLYIYFHLHVEVIWEDITSLPAISPDGVPLHRSVYPWYLIRLMALHVVRLDTNLREHLSLMRQSINAVFVILVWWLCPVVLVLFWGRYLLAREWLGSSLHVGLIVVAIGYGGLRLHSYSLERTMPNEPESKSFRWKTALTDSRTYQTGTALIIGAVLLGLTYGAFEGCRSDRFRPATLCTWVPGAFALIGFDPFADFAEANVSAKPRGWRGTADDLAAVEGAKLRGRDLRYADASGAFLVKADLHGANLRHADLSGANLSHATLSFADLQKANLSDTTNLIGADLTEANLRKADLRGATLRDTDLSNADLEKAMVTDADLGGARLIGANLRRADLHNARLDGAFLRNTSAQKVELVGADLRQAYLGNVDFRKAIIINADLSEADLQGSDLREAFLGGSTFRAANFHGVNLEGANFGITPGKELVRVTDLSGAALSGAVGLTGTQLDNACGDAETSLPPGLTIAPCPTATTR